MTTIPDSQFLSNGTTWSARSRRCPCLVVFAFFLCISSVNAQQQPTMPGMQMPQEHSDSTNAPEFPRLGRAQSNANAALFTLEHALEAARQHNPTYRQAEAGIRAARARTQQSVLYPNPTVGYAGD